MFTTETGSDAIDIRARMFPPVHGIIEDPATGSAVAALAGWLVANNEVPDGSSSWTIEQGVEMGRLSRLELAVDVENGAVQAVPGSAAAL